MDILEQTFLGNTLTTWLIALATAVLIFLILNALKRLVARRVLAWVEGTPMELDDLVIELFGQTWYLFLVVVSIYVGSLFLTMPQVKPVLRTIMAILFLAQVAVWSTGFINYLVSKRMVEKEEDDSAVINAVGFIGKAILWTAAVLLALDNIPGVEVDTLIASLGIGGIAVALAAQNILGDLFASLSIVLDEPFVVGDAIRVGDLGGTVEHIGLKSTRLRAFTGEQLVFANSDLLSSRIRNLGRMDERLVVFSLSVAYETPYEKLIRIPEIVQAIIKAQPQTSFGRVHFKAYGESSLQYEIVYRMLTANYTIFMDTKQAINLEIFRRFADEGIELPYPKQTVFVAK